MRRRATGTFLFAAGLATVAAGRIPVHAGPGLTTAWFAVSGPAEQSAVPDDGLLVEGNASGPTSVAAVRSDVGEVAAASLTFNVIDPGPSTDPPVLVACRATSDFTPGGGQTFDKAPGTDCSDAVDGVLSQDGHAVTFGLTTLVRQGLLSVVIRPGSIGDRPAAVGGANVRIVLQVPQSIDVTTTGGGSAMPMPGEPTPLVPTGPAAPAVLGAPEPTGSPVTAPVQASPRFSRPTAALSDAASHRDGRAGWFVLALGVPLALAAWRPPGFGQRIVRSSEEATP